MKELVKPFKNEDELLHQAQEVIALCDNSGGACCFGMGSDDNEQDEDILF